MPMNRELFTAAASIDYRMIAIPTERLCGSGVSRGSQTNKKTMGYLCIVSKEKNNSAGELWKILIS